MSPTFTLATAKERGNARGDVNKTNSNPGFFGFTFQYMRSTAIIIRRVQLVLRVLYRCLDFARRKHRILLQRQFHADETNMDESAMTVAA